MKKNKFVKYFTNTSVRFLSYLLKIDYEFSKLFFKKEGTELLGIKYRNFWILSSILFFTFLAIGFGNGSLQYLGKKMNDPFINWVNIDVPYKRSEEIAKVKNILNTDSISSYFNYSNVTGYFRFALHFRNNKEEGTYQLLGRTIDIDNKRLLNEILSEKNKVAGRGFKNKNDIGLIVTRKFLKELNYNENTPFVLMSLPVDYDNNALVPVPVIAVVKELPGLVSFACTHYFFNQRRSAASGNPFRPDHTENLICFTTGDSLTAYSCYSSIQKFFENNEKYQKSDPMFSIENNELSYITGYNTVISFYPLPGQNKLDSIFIELKNSDELKSYTFYRFYEYKFGRVNTNESFDYLAVNFNSLEKVREFKYFMEDKFKISIEMSQIEARENYFFISKLTLIISCILIGFSVISITMFVSNVLTKHLDKIKMNIGTFMAFGVSNNVLLKVYITMIEVFILFSMIFSMIISFLIGNFGGIRLVLTILGIKLEQNETYFQLLNIWTIISIITILVISFIVLFNTANKIINNTPGDLIYNRTNSTKKK